ncbi:hypothetical protein M422DRAFT_189572, partial [Sphaerobolus stellatus SS14]
GLLGVLSIQVYIYYLCFPEDSNYVKTVVYSLLCLEMTQTIILTNDSWNCFVNAWGDPIRVEKFGAEWFNLPIMDEVIACIVQLFLAWRIWIPGRP